MYLLQLERRRGGRKKNTTPEFIVYHYYSIYRTRFTEHRTEFIYNTVKHFHVCVWGGGVLSYLHNVHLPTFRVKHRTGFCLLRFRLIALRPKRCTTPQPPLIGTTTHHVRPPAIALLFRMAVNCCREKKVRILIQYNAINDTV